MDENGQASIKSKDAQKLGMFTGTHGKENCLAVCRKFGLTGCEWDFAAGDCYAHMKSVSIGNDYRSSFCYKFNKYPGKMIQVTS